MLLLLPAAMFVYSSHGKWVFPPLLWSFPPSATLQAFLLLVAGHVPPLLPEPLRPPSLFIYSPIFSTQCAPPSLLRVFIVLIAY
jgi:hypothetical protein